MVVLVAVVLVVAGCGGEREAGTDQLAADLAEVKAERDQLAVQVRQLSEAGASVEANAIKDRAGCHGTLSAVAQRMLNARDALKAARSRTKAGTSWRRAICTGH
jgi:outer membrane murein-binding lipoprotein Lpp